MAGLRDVVTHNYDGIGYDMIWQVVTHDLPPIEGHLGYIITELLEDKEFGLNPLF